MISSVQYALRTLVAPWLALVAIILETANSFQRGRPWVGEGLWTVEWFGIVLFILGPLAAGAAAVDAARLSRPGNIHLVVSVPGPWRPYVRAAIWCAVPLAAVHVAAIVVGFVSGEVTNPSAGWLAVAAGAAVQCLVIAWFTAVGSALGRLLHPVAAGLSGSLVGFALSFVLGDASGSDGFALLDVGAATVSRLGLTYDYVYVNAQLAVLGVTAVLLLLVPTRAVRTVRVPGWTGAASVAAAVAVIVGAQANISAERLRADPHRPTACFDHAPRICLFEEHGRYASEVSDRVHELVAAARSHGYSSLVPHAVIESSRTFTGARPRVATLLLPLEPSQGDHLRLDDWVDQLAYPLHCPAVYSNHAPPPGTFFRRLLLVEVTWLHLVGIRSELMYAEPGLHVLTPSETADIMAGFAACDLTGDG